MPGQYKEGGRDSLGLWHCFLGLTNWWIYISLYCEEQKRKWKWERESYAHWAEKLQLQCLHTLGSAETGYLCSVLTKSSGRRQKISSINNNG